MSQKFTVDWQIDHPPVEPRSEFAWTQKRLTGMGSRPEDGPILEALGWHSSTLMILRKAFEERLDRFTGWSHQKEEPLADALRQGSAVFKRGVGLKIQSDLSFNRVTLKGTYDIALRPSSDREIIENSLIIIDQDVYQLWWEKAGLRDKPPIEWSEDQMDHLVWTIPSHERSKTLGGVAELIKRWKSLKTAHEAHSSPQKLPRRWVIIGGGLLGDMAAFAAGLAQVSVVYIPTTLLAMVDASLGGKTGVNFEPYGKNQLGLFYFPEAVWIWEDWLKTLPVRQWRSGAMECLKHALLMPNPNLLAEVEYALRDGDRSRLLRVILDLIKVKADLVAQDPGEKGIRAILNFGHTFGHALETLSQKLAGTHKDHLLHGEAVGLGMIFALKLSEEVAGFSSALSEKVVTTIKKALLGDYPFYGSDICQSLGVKNLREPYLWPELLRLMGGDKKNVGSHLRWVLLKSPGMCFQDLPNEWTVAVSKATLAHVWSRFVEDLEN